MKSEDNAFKAVAAVLDIRQRRDQTIENARKRYAQEENDVLGTISAPDRKRAKEALKALGEDAATRDPADPPMPEHPDGLAWTTGALNDGVWVTLVDSADVVWKRNEARGMYGAWESCDGDHVIHSVD